MIYHPPDLSTWSAVAALPALMATWLLLRRRREPVPEAAAMTADGAGENGGLHPSSEAIAGGAGLTDTAGQPLSHPWKPPVPAEFTDNPSYLAEELRRLQLMLQRGAALVSRIGELGRLVVSQNESDQWEANGQIVDDWWTRAAEAPQQQEQWATLVRWRKSINARAEVIRKKPETPDWLGFATIRHWYNLQDEELDLLILATAPHLNPRYERLFGYLQENGSRTHLSVDLALNLIAENGEAKLALRRLLEPDGKLRRYHLLELATEPFDSDPTLLRRYLRVDERFLAFVLAQPPPAGAVLEVDERPDALRHFPVRSRARRELRRLAAALSLGETPRVVRLLGPDRELLHQAAHVIAARMKRPFVFRLDLNRPDATPAEVALALRDARLWAGGLIICSDGVGESTLRAEAALWEAVRHSRVTLLVLLGPARAFAGLPDFLAYWPLELAREDAREFEQGWAKIMGVNPEAGAARELADALRFTQPHMAQAGVVATGYAVARDARAARPVSESKPASPPRRAALAGRATLFAHPKKDDLLAAGRALTLPRLHGLASRIEVRSTWDDLVLPPDREQQLRGLATRARHRREIAEAGFGGTSLRGQGFPVLFTGPPGTGKTLAAEVLAGDLGMELLQIDLSAVVSRYIGETEKNLSLIFESVEQTLSVLFFDEADSLCGKRTEIKDAHDRFANLEVNYLLQRVESYRGVVILATNFPQNLDAALLRRISDRVDFPVPDLAMAEKLWELHFPSGWRYDEDECKALRRRFDLPALARQFRLTGAGIRGAVLHAAHAARNAGGVEKLTTQHLVRGIAAQYRKEGRLCAKTDFGPYYDLLRTETKEARNVVV